MDLRLQEKILLTLYGKTEPATITEITKMLDIFPQNIVYIIDRLERRNLITTKKEGRVRLCKLTEKGELVAKKLKELADIYEFKI